MSTQLTEHQSRRRAENSDHMQGQRPFFNNSRRRNDGAFTVRQLLKASLVPAFALNIVAVVVLFTLGGGFSSHSTANAWTLIIGRITGLLAVNLIMLQLLLIGRNEWLDKLAGLDTLARWHARLGRWAFSLLLVHVTAIVVGYAGNSMSKIPHEIAELVLRTRDIMMATVAFGLFIAVAVTSIRMARRRLKYQTWHFVHLYAYAAVALSLPHQIFLGSHFAHTIPEKIYWSALYAGCVGSLLLFRVIHPIRQSLRHRLHVLEVVRESNDVVSVYISGRNLHRIHAKPGQFFIWRFLDKGRWSEAHPYSLSAAPNGDYLRLSVKALGDASAALGELSRGTKVIAEGPYGIFTSDVRSRRKVTLIAGGIGITPIRAMAETFPARPGDVTVIYRVRNEASAVFLDELREIAAERHMNLHVIADETLGDAIEDALSPRHLLKLCPDLAEQDVYLCGPPMMTERVVANLHTLGLENDQIHFERFEF